ncbi:MAG: hypothetical protein CM15mV1_3080 [uncultured marine virus]|nr:MAG: hypothetical protein CM15mV1_3080 [uncultured marine virus]
MVCPRPVAAKSPADAFTNVRYLSFESETELTSIELDLCAVEIEPEIVPLICPVTIRSEATLTESDPVAALMYKSPELVLIVLASTVAIPILPATIPFPGPCVAVIPLVNVDIPVILVCAVISTVFVEASSFRFPAEVLIVVLSTTPI